MAIFRNIVFCAALVGLIVGLALSVAQHFATTPLILRAEVYEKSAEAQAVGGSNLTNTNVTHTHDGPAHPHASASEAAAHIHNAQAWEPRDGVERTAFTVVSNIVIAIGYALALTGCFSLLGGAIDWRRGLYWGLGGFLAVMVAPSLGLPPELPGVPAAALAERQLWFVGTAVATALGLALIAFGRRPPAVALALCLIIAPHIIGAPQLADVETNVPTALSHQFTVAVTVTSLLFWALLGSLSGAFHRRFITA